MKKFLFISAVFLSTLFLNAQEKRIVLFGGKSVHPYSAHENTAVCDMLKDSLKEAIPQAKVDVVKDDFPDSLDFFKGASLLVIFGEGEKHHPLFGREKMLEEINNMGVSIMIFHYALILADPKFNSYLDNTIAAHYEHYFSVNPHWTASAILNPTHPISRGVKPFVLHDEWYFNLRFKNDAKITNILQAIPTDEAYNRPDGRHTGNKYMRTLKGAPTTLAWAVENPNGTKGFGFTGWHEYFNYNNDSFRKLIINAIAWAAGYEIPENGFNTKAPSIDKMDSLITGKTKPNGWEKNLELWRSRSSDWHK